MVRVEHERNKNFEKLAKKFTGLLLSSSALGACEAFSNRSASSMSSFDTWDSEVGCKVANNTHALLDTSVPLLESAGEREPDSNAE